MYHIYGFAPDEQLTPNAILQRVHPEDADLVRKTIDDAAIKGAAFSIDHRIMRSPTDVRWLHVEGRVRSTQRDNHSASLARDRTSRNGARRKPMRAG